MDRIAYLDFVAVPLYGVILYATYARKMTNGTSNRIFTLLIWASLITAVADLISGVASANFPLSAYETGVVAVASYIYYIFHILVPIIFLLFLFAETRMAYWMKQGNNLLITFVPYFALMALLAVNPFTGWVFTVTRENGYQRGPLIYAFYIAALAYSTWGLTYLLRRIKMFPMSKFVSLFMMYFLNGAAVIFQLLFPQYLVEMIFTAMAELFVILLVMRPEDLIDYSTGMPNFRAYRSEIQKITSISSREKIVVMRIINARQLMHSLGDEKYITFIKGISSQIRKICDKDNVFYSLYFEHPGRFYLIIDNYDFDFQLKVNELYQGFFEEMSAIELSGGGLIPRFCEIKYPQDCKDAETIINIGHQFHRIIPGDQLYTQAEEIVNSKGFSIKNNIDHILSRAIREKRFEMYYQPIYSVRERRFVSAEALIRLNDEEYGIISPGIFIPAAERKGLMGPIGDFVLESVFRFISENDLRVLGLSYIELNLSVAQCLQSDLSDKILALQKKYHINPECVNLEITESTYENFSQTTDMNIRRLSENGFTFSLDDYGTGYSNMHRISRLPLKIIKIDKTLVDDMARADGLSVLENTVTMMKDIRKEIVCEGVETSEQLAALEKMDVDFIQGFFFSKPLPEESFVAFVKEHNAVQTA